MILKLECDTYLNKEGVLQFHYPDTSLVFEQVGENMYAFDRDCRSIDVFKQGNIEDILFEYLGQIYYNKFFVDFGNKGLHLCSDFDTHSLSIKY